MNSKCCWPGVQAIVSAALLAAFSVLSAEPGPSPTAVAAEKPVRDAAGFKGWLDGHLAQPRFSPAAWGIKIVSLDSGKTFYEHDAGKLLKPASNTKLFTGALALDRLGPEFRIRTSVFARSRPDAAGTVEGDVIVFGRGDPSFAARFNNGSHADNLAPLANAMTNAGIRRITGKLVADESFFRGPPLGSGWMWDDLEYYYGAEVSSLTFEENVVDLAFKPGKAVGAPLEIITMPHTSYLTFSNRTTTVAEDGRIRVSLQRPLGRNTVYVHGQMPLGSGNYIDAVTVHQPAAWFAMMLKEALIRRGVAVEGSLVQANWLDREVEPLNTSDWTEVAFAESPPLREILGRMLKPSQNLYAQLLLLQVGAQTEVTKTNSSFRTTEQAGLAEMGRFLREVGVRHGDTLLEEGSGLSRGTLLTPNATVALLRHMARHRDGELFRASLPLAGVDGTLRRRMKGTPAEKNAQAKTGTLRFVFALSGHVTARSGEQFVFSLMLNNHDADDGAARSELDAIVVMLAGLEER
jgi:serine-type D-Ala-D-Ala carboxypeptidase/endopeptidase (penicillin-binding protein 4)